MLVHGRDSIPAITWSYFRLSFVLFGDSSNVEEGGETVFPAAKVNSSEVPDWEQRSQCAKAGISVRPRMGDALLFWSMKPDAKLDPTSLHGTFQFHFYGLLTVLLS